MIVDPSDLEALLSLRDLSQEEAAALYKTAETHVNDGSGYGSLKGLTELYNPDTMPGRMYFQDGAFIMLYIYDPAVWDRDGLITALDGRFDGLLPSQMGKHHSLYVYARRGLAFSADEEDGSLDYLEVFPPSTYKKYKAQFYEAPGKFIK